jgi:hypothetical protein
MSNPDQSLAEINLLDKQNSFSQRKFIYILMFVISLLVISLTVFYLFKLKMSKPTSLDTLNEYQKSKDFPKTDNSSIVDLADDGYRLECQIFLEDIIYPNQVFADFIIHSAAPCWFYDNNNQLSSVNVPIVIEDTLSQEWTHIGLMRFVPLFANLDKDTAIKAFSQYPFAGESDGLNPRIYDSIVVRLKFAKQTPYQDYYEGHYELEGEYIAKPEFYSERLLLQLANQHQNREAIEYLVKHNQWNKELDDYLFYHYAEREFAK